MSVSAEWSPVVSCVSNDNMAPMTKVKGPGGGKEESAEVMVEGVSSAHSWIKVQTMIRWGSSHHHYLTSTCRIADM